MRYFFSFSEKRFPPARRSLRVRTRSEALIRLTDSDDGATAFCQAGGVALRGATQRAESVPFVLSRQLITKFRGKGEKKKVLTARDKGDRRRGEENAVKSSVFRAVRHRRIDPGHLFHRQLVSNR